MKGDVTMLFDMFRDTVFLKETTDMEKKYNALLKLRQEYPNNNKIKEEAYMVKKGLEGEKEIKYQLAKSNLGLFVIQDLNIEYENLKAQIDYVVITKRYCYFIECKNLIGNITVNEKGDFIREYTIHNQKIKKGMYSPLRQVEAQRDVYKKLWNNHLSKNKILNDIKRLLAEKNFTDTYRTLVVAANHETILNTRYAPKDIKYKVIKADALVRKIQYDLEHSNREDWSSKNEMKKWADTFLKLNVEKEIDYYKIYKQKLIENTQTKILNIKQKDELLKNKLIQFRKTKSGELNIPAYYIFNNQELEQLISTKPKTIEELTNSKILSQVKVKLHGKEIINIIILTI